MKKLTALALLPAMGLSSVGAATPTLLGVPMGADDGVMTITTTNNPINNLIKTAEKKVSTSAKMTIAKKIEKLSDAEKITWLIAQQTKLTKQLAKTTDDKTKTKLNLVIDALATLLAETNAKISADKATATKGGKYSDKIAGGEMYEMTQPKYSYTGTGFDIGTGSVEVLKKVMVSPLNNGFSGLSTTLSLNKFNLQQLQNITFGNITLSENRDNGYDLYIDTKGGTVQLSAQYDRWANPCRNSSDDQCYIKNAIKIGEVLNDDLVMTIAREFVSRYGIDISNFGAPVINNDWKTQYTSAVKKEEAYIPESASVFYPLLLNGKNVYEQSGEKAGITINVDYRTKLVNGMFGLEYYNTTPEQVERIDSASGAVVSATAIEDYSKRMASDAKMDEQMKINYVNVGLGTPTMGYVKVWDEKLTYPNNTVLVPALIFPTQKDGVKTDMYVSQNVIVPLAKKYQNTLKGPMLYKDGMSSREKNAK